MNMWWAIKGREVNIREKTFRHTENNKNSWELIKINKNKHLKNEKQVPANNKIGKRVNSNTTVSQEEVNKTQSTLLEMSANNKLSIE